MSTRNQVEGLPIRTAPSAAAVAGTKTGRKKPRTQEQSTLVQPIIPGTLAKGLAGAHFGEKDQMKLKNETVG